MSGDLPNGWEQERLGNLASKIGSGATPKGGEQSYKATGIPLIRSMNVHFDGFHKKGLAFLDDEQAAALNGVTVQADDVLLNITGASIGRVTTAPSDMNNARVNQHVCIIRPHEGIEALFVARYLASPSMQTFIAGENYGVTRQALTKEMVESIELPVPPAAEQHRIVEKIDSLFTRSTRARDELAHIPRLIERYRQAVLEAAFRGDLTADWRAKHNPPKPLLSSSNPVDGRVEELGTLPDEWIWHSLGDVCDVTGGLTKNQARNALPTKMAYLRVANVYANELRLDEIEEIGVTPNEANRVRVGAGDLLIVEGNGSLDQIGRVAIWNDEIADCGHQNHLIKARPLTNVVPKFVLYWLLSPPGRAAIEVVASSSSGLHTLSITKVKGLPIPCCSPEEMQVIVEHIESRLDVLNGVTAQFNRAMDMLPRLDQSILNKAFSGQLVPQDPTDEPAAILLDRIKATRTETMAPKRGRRTKN